MRRQLWRLGSWGWVLVLGLLALGLGACDGRLVLPEDQALERQLRKEERHRYRVVVPAGHLVEVLVTPLEEPEDTLVVWVFGPRFRRPVPLNGYPNPPDHTVRWLLATRETRATYRLEVRTQDGAPGRYRIVANTRPLQSGDLARAAAVRRVAEGLRQEQLAQEQDAIENLRSAAATWRLLGERLEMAQTLRRSARLTLGKYQWREALKDCEPAIAVFFDLGEPQAEGETLGLCARAYRWLGEHDRAKGWYESALALAKAHGLPKVEGSTYHNLALLLSDQGEYELADWYFRQALAVYRAREEKRHVATVLMHSGVNLIKLGKTEAAKKRLEEAHALFSSLKLAAELAPVLAWQGWIHSRNGELPAAVECYQDALGLFRAEKIEGGLEHVTALENFGRALSDAGQYEEAEKLFQEALVTFEGRGEATNVASALADLAQLKNRLGEFDKAYDYCERALALLPQEDQDTRVHVLFIRAQTEQRNRNLVQAAETMEELLEVHESFRTSGHGTLRLSYFSELNAYYEFYVDLLMSLYEQKRENPYAERALEISERTRARSLLDALGESSLPSSKGARPESIELRTLRQQLEQKAFHLRRLWASAASEEEISVAKQELVDLVLRHERQEADGQRLARSGEVQRPLSPAILREIKNELLNTESLLLAFAIGKERSFLWVVDQEGLTSFELPGRERLEGEVQYANKLLQGGDPETETSSAHAAAELGDLLLAPAAHLLGKRRLLIVADGVLQQVPFAALRWTLPGGGESEPLLATHEIVSLPSASVALALRVARLRQPAKKPLAIFADPVFSGEDPRLQVVAGKNPATVYGLNLDRLEHSGEEARAIFARAPEGSFLASDFAATKEAVTQGRLRDYRFVHLATHGLLDTEYPQLSGVVLTLIDASGRPLDGVLRLHEIHDLELNADLVTLSACETALGKEFHGEGVISLARAFLQAGALSVVVSLWKVDDAATAELMKRFYQELFEGSSPPAALQKAQLSIRADPMWQAPYYWAGFIFQGEWEWQEQSPTSESPDD